MAGGGAPASRPVDPAAGRWNNRPPMSASAAASTRAALGGAFILLAESAVIAGWTPISTWTTPICWWGYILVLDALVQSRSGRTLLGARPGRFASWTLLSIGFWLVFEAYNLKLRN